MKRRFYRLGTPEAARKLLFRWVKEGKITVEDIDKESSNSAFTRKQVEKYYPEIKLKPHRNLLREHPDEPIHEIKVTEERDFPTSPRSSPQNEGIRPQVLLPEEQADSSLVSVNDLSW